MKAIPLILVSALLAIGATAQDVRKVNGIPADVSPVAKWFAGGQKGERPMPHWKQVRIMTFVAPAPWLKCQILLDTGEQTEVFIKNPPPVFKAHYTAILQAEAKVKQLGPDKAKKRIEYEQAQKQLNMLKGKKLVELAMPNGKYGNTPIWDCGK